MHSILNFNPQLIRSICLQNLKLIELSFCGNCCQNSINSTVYSLNLRLLPPILPCVIYLRHNIIVFEWFKPPLNRLFGVFTDKSEELHGIFSMVSLFTHITLAAKISFNEYFNEIHDTSNEYFNKLRNFAKIKWFCQRIFYEWNIFFHYHFWSRLWTVGKLCGSIFPKPDKESINNFRTNTVEHFLIN